MAPARWGPAKPREAIKVVRCGSGVWDERDHKLDVPYPIETIDFRITGTGHERIERTFAEGCSNCRQIVGFNEKQIEHKIAAWLCQHACSFVLFDTKARATVIGFERNEDAVAFGQEFATRQK